MDTVACLGCGTPVEVSKRTRKTVRACSYECEPAYARSVIPERIVIDGDHMLWTGSWSGTTDIPVVYGRQGKGMKKRNYNVRRLLWEDVHGTLPDTSLRRLCDIKECVAPEHHLPYDEWGKHYSPKAHRRPIGGKLPAEPLLQLYDYWRIGREELGEPIPELFRRRMCDVRQQGWVTVDMADAICCDYLHVHPYQLWGERYFTEGSTEAAA